jgi:predicted nucleic acid-binding protein
MIVVDASILLELLLRTGAAARIQSRILRPGLTLHCPHLLDVEVAQVLRRFSLAGQLETDRALQVLEDLRDLPLTRYPHEPFLNRTWELRRNLSAYDATYIALAETLGVSVLTHDAKLSKAPGHDATVELV